MEEDPRSKKLLHFPTERVRLSKDIVPLLEQILDNKYGFVDDDATGWDVLNLLQRIENNERGVIPLNELGMEFRGIALQLLPHLKLLLEGKFDPDEYISYGDESASYILGQLQEELSKGTWCNRVIKEKRYTRAAEMMIEALRDKGNMKLKEKIPEEVRQLVRDFPVPDSFV